MVFTADNDAGLTPELDTTPQSPEAEQALLGALLYDNEIYHRVSGIVQAKHFYNPIHLRIYDSIASLIEHGKLADAIVLKGIPAEGLGVYNAPSDVMDIDLTFKPTALNCYEEGPRSQSCRIDAGGFITWVEYGQRRHIKAQGGLVDVTLWHQQGARCNA